MINETDNFIKYNHVVIEVICNYYKTSYYDLSSQLRTSGIVEARQLAMYFCSTILNGSDDAVATLFDRKRPLTSYNVNHIRRRSALLYFDKHVDYLRQLIYNRLANYNCNIGNEK